MPRNGTIRGSGSAPDRRARRSAHGPAQVITRAAVITRRKPDNHRQVEGTADDPRGGSALCCQSPPGAAPARCGRSEVAQRPANHGVLRRHLLRRAAPGGSRDPAQNDLRIPALVENQATGETEEPADNWGELRFCSVATEIGAEWTDHGTRRDHRQLKARARGEWRQAPVPPHLTRILRQHLHRYGTGPGGRLFSGLRGGELASVTYRRVWDDARQAALTAAEYQSPLGRRVYDLRHACLSTWLNEGVPRHRWLSGLDTASSPAQGLRQVH